MAQKVSIHGEDEYECESESDQPNSADENARVSGSERSEWDDTTVNKDQKGTNYYWNVV